MNWLNICNCSNAQSGKAYSSKISKLLAKCVSSFMHTEFIDRGNVLLYEYNVHCTCTVQLSVCMNIELLYS